ncbi:hypothetical protein [Pseudoalteromonas spongiae]|nr:hypothetical protein [Pseudoalteromonas spongiae]
MECIALTKRNERFVVLPLALFCLAKIAQPEIYLKLKDTFRYNANITSLEYDPTYKDLKNYNARNRQMEFSKQDILQQCFEVLQYSSDGNLKEPGNSRKTISKLFFNKNSVEQLNYFPVHKYFELIESAVRFKSNI